MITVNVLINERTVLTRSARNVAIVNGNIHQYLCDDGRTIVHRREDGAAILAAKMLEGIIDIDQLQVKKAPILARFAAWILNLKIS